MGGVEFLSEKILNADIRALRGAISDAGIDLTTKQGKKELADLMFGKVPKSLRVAVEEPLEEAIVSATGEVMQAAIEGKPINVANIAEGALAGLGAGAGISVLTNGISAIGKTPYVANIIKTQSQIKKLSDLMNDPSISEEEKAVLRPKLEQLIKDDKKIRENSADYYSKFTDEDVQETVKLNQIISEGIKNYSKMTTPEAKAEVAANVKAAMEAKKAIETKYDSQEGVDEIMSLPDDQVISFNVESLDQVPEQFRDRAEKKNDFEFKVRETILGLPFGKETTKVVNQGYSYTLTGKEAKDYAAQNKTVDTKYDSQEGQQVPGTQQTGEAPIQAQPVEGAGAEAAPAGGVVQEEAKPVEEAVAEEVDTKEEDSEIEFYDSKIIDLESEIEIEKGNLKEEKAEIDQQIKDVRADKTLKPAERREKIENLQARKQDIINDLTGNIEVYKEEIKAFKSDIKKLEKAKAKKLEKAKAAPVAAPVAQAAPVQPMAEPVVAETATAQEDATAETTQEAAPVKETKKPAGKVASKDEVASRIASSPSKARMYTAVKRATNSLKKLFPDAEYVFVDSDAEAAEYYKQNMEKVPADEKGTDKGRIIQNKNNGKIEIVINTSSADATTVYHELFHAAFFKAYAQDAATAIDFANRLSKVLNSGTAAEKAIAKRVDEHVAKYDGDTEGVVSEEFLSELAGILAADAKSITQGMAAKIANFINNIAKKMGIGPVFTEAATTKEVVDFMNSFAAAAREGGNVLAFLDGPVESFLSTGRNDAVDIEVRASKQKSTQTLEEARESIDKKLRKFFPSTSDDVFTPQEMRVYYMDDDFQYLKKYKTTYEKVADMFAHIAEQEDVYLFPSPNLRGGFLFGDFANGSESMDMNVELGLNLNGDVYIEAIEALDTDGAGKGAGTRLMNRIIQAADDLGIKLALDAYPTRRFQYDKETDRKLTDKQLEKMADRLVTDFYSKFGFVSESSSPKNKAKFRSMYREPGAKSSEINDFESRSSKFDNLPEEVKNGVNSITNAVDFASNSSFPNKLVFKEKLQERFNKNKANIQKKYKIKSFESFSKTNVGLKKYLSDAYIYETLVAIQAYPDALGWYDYKTRAAMSIMGLVHPELNTDKNAADAFKIALAITSNGNKVFDNFKEADRQYVYFKENGKFDNRKSIGTQSSGIKKTFALVNDVLGRMPMEDFSSFLTSKFRAGDLKYKKGGKMKNLLTGFTVDTEVYGASVFGPKIGNGFFMNLNGQFDQLTMDRWFIRQFGRLTGSLIKRSPKQISKATTRLNESFSALNKEERAKVASLIPGFSKMSFANKAAAISKTSMDTDNRAELSSTPALNELRKAGNSLNNKLSGEVEAPSGGNQRSFIIDVFNDVQQRLKDEYGIDITIADLQAVNWYPEKALYKTFKAGQDESSGATQTSDNEQPDYESAAIKLAESRGITKKQIDDVRTIERDRQSFGESVAGAAELISGDNTAASAKEIRRKILSVKAGEEQVVEFEPRSSKLNYDKGGFDADELASLPKSTMTKAKIQDVINSGTYAFLTAENPNNKKPTLEENASYMAAAKAWLSKRGYKPTAIYGMYTNKENSFFIPDMSFKDAEAFRKKFKQESVAHSEALVYEDTYQERIPGENSFNANYKDPKNDYYSVFKDREGNVFGVSTTYADDTQPLSNFESRSSKAEEASEVAREVVDQYYKNRGNVDQNWMQKLAGNVYSNMVRTPEQMEALRIKETRDSKTSRQALRIRRMAENLYNLIKDSGSDAAALVTEYMSGPTAQNIDAIENLKNGAKILDAATEMRAFLDQMSRQLVDGPAFAALNQELKEVILGNVGSYLKTSYRFWKDKNYKITDKAIKNAAAHVYDVIRAKKMGLLVKEGKTQQEIEEFLEATKEQMFREAVQQINDYVREIEKIRSAPKFKGYGMVTAGQVKIPGESFQKRKDIPAYIQELLGVEKDPQIRFIDTALALTNILYKGEMASKMANAFGNDFFISDDVITKEDRESGLYKMVKDEYSPLNRMWVPTDIFKVINNEDIYSSDIKAYQYYYNVLQFSRKTKVIYNLPTWRKNITGGWQIIMANGILNPQFLIDLANRPAFTLKGKETEAMTQLLDEMAQYGLIGGDVNANLINGVDAMYSGILRGDYSYSDKVISQLKGVDKKFSERYSAIDDYTKMIIYRNKRNSFAKKLYGANYDTLSGSQQERVREAAAEETKQTTPTFSRLPSFYRVLAKFPVGDFLSFKLEAIRSLTMIYATAVDDIKKSMDSKLSAVQRAEYAKTGLAKFMGASGALSLSYVIPGMIESALGFDEEETEDMKLLRPDWMSGDNILVKRADKNGNVSVYDLTMEDTYGDISSMVVNLNAGELGEVFDVFKDPIRFNMTINMLFNLAEKKDQYGRPLFESYDSGMTQSWKVIKYLAKETIIPPFLYSSGRDAGYTAEQTGESILMLAGSNVLKRTIIRDYQYNIGQQFYFDALDGAEGIKKDEQYTNLTGEEYKKRLADIDLIKQKYEAIVRYGNLYDNYDMVKSAKSAIKKYYGKDEERYILYGQLN